MKGPGVTPGSESPGSTSTSLLVRLKAQDPDAWRRMASLYGPLVYGWCRRKGLGGDDAADLVQEVFRAVVVNLAGFVRRPAGSFRGWLWTITRSRLLDFFRRRRNSPEGAGGSEGQNRLLAVPERLDESSTPPEMGSVLRRALDLIRPDFKEASWQAFWRVVIEDRPPADVAAELGISINAVLIAKSRILSRLRQELGEPSGEG